MAYKVLIVDDFMMSRQVFENAVLSSDDYKLEASLATASDAVEYLKKKDVDLVIMDIVMTEGPNGLAAAKMIKDSNPNIKIIIVTSMPEVSYISRAKQIGVESFWYKEVQEQPILEIMSRTMAGESIYPSDSPVVPLGNAISIDLTDREIEVLRLLTDGASNKEIAETLNLSERTVKMHSTNMIQKTGFRSRLELAVKARIGGLVIPD